MELDSSNVCVCYILLLLRNRSGWSGGGRCVLWLVSLLIPSQPRNSGPIWGNWELKKFETGRQDREQPKPAESQKTCFCTREWKKWLKVSVDSTLWPEIGSLEINCFLVVYVRAPVGKRMPVFGKFLLPNWKSERCYLIESLNISQTYIVLVRRSWCLLITNSLNSSAMGIRLVSGIKKRSCTYIGW